MDGLSLHVVESSHVFIFIVLQERVVIRYTEVLR